MSTEEAQVNAGQESSTDPEAAESIDEKEQLLQRRLARIEEALGLSPLT
ncbi:hypothetical protein [Pseudomonas sp. URIL14HWK12:I5]|nr:hypothetical protein [Pseudomonas sp. URIL14HWK12:I5]SMC69613.1 hypothetical protein SAMN05660385_02052 [Pseudomonas sp. URIL14HWK12:I5]